MCVYFGDWYNAAPPVVMKSCFLVVSKNFLVYLLLKHITI